MALEILLWTGFWQPTYLFPCLLFQVLVSTKSLHPSHPDFVLAQLLRSMQLMSSGQLEASDAGTYTITSSDFTGALMVTIKINSECGAFVLHGV